MTRLEQSLLDSLAAFRRRCDKLERRNQELKEHNQELATRCFIAEEALRRAKESASCV